MAPPVFKTYAARFSEVTTGYAARKIKSFSPSRLAPGYDVGAGSGHSVGTEQVFKRHGTEDLHPVRLCAAYFYELGPIEAFPARTETVRGELARSGDNRISRGGDSCVTPAGRGNRSRCKRDLRGYRFDDFEDSVRPLKASALSRFHTRFGRTHSARMLTEMGGSDEGQIGARWRHPVERREPFDNGTQMH